MENEEILSKSLEILEYIYLYDQEFGRPPTARQIAEHAYVSQTYVRFYLGKLVEWEYLRVVAGKQRARFVTPIGKKVLERYGLIPLVVPIEG
jgi:DNA-binding MarR family transcriptional regulator